MVEHGTENPRVTSSILVLGTQKNEPKPCYANRAWALSTIKNETSVKFYFSFDFGISFDQCAFLPPFFIGRISQSLYFFSLNL